MTNATAAAPSLSRSLCALLQALNNGAGRDDKIVCSARSGTSAIGPAQMQIRVAEIEGTWVPTPLVKRLEVDGAPWSLALAARDRGGLQLASLSALIAVWQFERVYENPRDPSSPYGRLWLWPAAAIEQAVARANALLPVTLIVDAQSTITAVWGLTAPIDVSHLAGEQRAMSLLRRLGSAVGASVPADDARLADVSIPLPGFRSAATIGAVVTCPACNPAVRYTLAEIEAALAPGAPSAKPQRGREPRS
jgi:hypothetical protein